MRRPPLPRPRYRRREGLRPEPLEHRWLLSVTPTWEHAFGREGYLSGPAEGDPLAIAEAYLEANAADFGLSTADLSGYVVTDRYTDAHNGVTHLYLRQTLHGLPIADADINVNVSSAGEVINVGSRFLSNLVEARTVSATPQLSAAEAVAAAAAAYDLKLTGPVRQLSDYEGFARSTALAAPGLSLDDVPATLHYVFDPETGVELAWNLVLRTPGGGHWYESSIDASDGRLLRDADWIDHAAYNVYAWPTEAPNDGSRSLVVDPHDPLASPYGWHDVNGSAGAEFTDTRGNNVFAQEDQDANNTGGARPSGGASLTFDFPVNFASAPQTYVSASTTNLFYWNNVLHDIHYQYGFTEAAGNFQFNNYGRGGLANDPVYADDLDGSGTNNATFGTPPDGSSPRMTMFRFTVTNPNRNSSFDNPIVIHEYGHGVSNRLTGGPGNASALNAQQSGGMGEGWSDWWSLMLTQKPTDTIGQAYPVATYVLGQSISGSGIRRQPYSYDMSINNQTMGWYNNSDEVHDAGELWCATLWDMNWLLVQKYGFDPDFYHGSGGNNVALQLVMDGLKLQPSKPTFIEARDAILLADRVLTGGLNQLEIWTAFARRGFGLSASAGANANALTVFEAFDLPDLSLKVVSSTPAAGGYTNSALTSFVLDFDAPYLPSSIQLTDFAVNGIHPTSFQFTDADTVTFHYAASPAAAQGPHVMTLAADSVLRLLDNDGVNAFTGTFYRDNAEMLVVAATPAHGSNVTLPLTLVRLDFSENFDPATVGLEDLWLSEGTVTAFHVVDSNTIEYTIAGTVTEGALVVRLQQGAVTDVHGNPIPGAYEVHYNADIGTIDFPTPLAVVGPASSLVYDPPFAASIGTVGDVDSFAIDVEAGVSLSVLLEPDPLLRPVLTIRNSANVVVATATASAQGENLWLQSLKAPAGGERFTVSVEGTAATSGPYAIGFTLNAALEGETHGGGSNDTRPNAQSLDGAWVTVPGGVERAAVVGRADASLESEPNNSTGQANSITSVFGPYDGARYQLSVSGSISASADVDWVRLGTFEPGDVVTVALSGSGSSQGTHNNLKLEMFRNSIPFADDDNEGPGNDALIYRRTITIGGVYNVKISSATLQTGSYRLSAWLENQGPAPANGPGSLFEIEPNDVVATATDASNSWIKVTHRASVGGVIGIADVDYYSFSLAAGDVITVAADSTSALDAQIALRNSAGTVLASENGSSIRMGADSWVFSYPIFSSGTYYLSVTTAAGLGGYSADVYRATTQNLPLPTIGFDYYSLHLEDDDLLTIAVGTFPLEGTVSLSIEDTAGVTLATGVAGGSYDHVIRGFVPPAAGLYYLRVGTGTSPYTLIVQRGAELDTDANEEFATALDISTLRKVVGSVTDGLPRIQAETEPNDNGVPGAQPDDLLLANEASASFVYRGNGQYVATITGLIDDWYDFDWDFFRIRAKPGDTLTIALNAEDSTLDPLVRLLNASGTQIAADDDGGAIGTNSLLVYSDFAYDGEYYMVADSWAYTTGLYTLVATLTTDAVPPALDEDYYQFHVTAGEPIYLSTTTPFDAPREPTNALDPILYLYDPTGALVAVDDNSAGDGRNARIVHTAALTGSYRVRVVAAPGSTGAYILNAAAVDTVPPSIAQVALGGGTHADYVVPTGSGEQLRSANLALLTTIKLTFGEDVLVAQDDLTLSGQSTPAYAFSGFHYDPVTFTATWTLASPIRADRLSLLLSDRVTDAQGNALDGEFDNPTALNDPTSSVAAGNGVPGGDFEFHFTVLAADGNRDNRVTGADFTIWSDGFGLFNGNAGLTHGDYNGDGYVTGADFTIWSDLFGIDHSSFAISPDDSTAPTIVAPESPTPLLAHDEPTPPVAPREASPAPSLRLDPRAAVRLPRPRPAAPAVEAALFRVDQDWLR